MSLRKQQQNGSSLIEIMVTVLVFSIGMLGMAALQLTALRSTSDSSQRSQAIWLVQDIAERMRANPSGSIADYTGNASAPDCTALPVNQCADRYNPTSSAVVSATTCSPSQMAAFDRWEATCSYAGLNAYSTNNGRATSRDFITLRDGTPLLSMTANGTTVELSASVGSKLSQKAGSSNVVSDNSIPTIQVQR